MPATSLDAHGRLRGFGYHDGALRSVVLSDGNAMLGVRSVEGTHHVIELNRVVAFCADGVREGNIILNIRLLNARVGAEDPELTATAKERLHVNLDAVDRALFVFQLESSYGADVIALCADWTVVAGQFVLLRDVDPR